MADKKDDFKRTPLGKTNWLVMILLGLSGQIAWNVENSWFNTFVFDTITPDPGPIAVMVGVSSVVATVTTLIMGTLSDRIGKRKPFIWIGYLLWALSTMAYPLSGIVSAVSIGVIMAVLLDAVMTFFGSTANDAAFNAWVTDITDTTNRGLAEGVLNLLPVAAAIIGMGFSGIIIDRWGYFPFFLSLGVIVLIMGMTGSVFLKENTGSPIPKTPAEETAAGRKSSGNTLTDTIGVFSPQVIKQNRNLYIMFITVMLFNISYQIVYPYEMIYLNNYIGISKSTAGILVALVAPVLLVLALPVGQLTDKGKGFPVLICGYLVSAAGQFLFSLTDNIVLLIITGILKNIGVLMLIVLGAWIRNLMPPDSRGRFQGVRLLFFVMLPMLIGPAIGSALISRWGVPAVRGDISGFVPVPLIYRISALAGLLPLIPVAILGRTFNKEA